jgi:hypothetical protein
MSYTISKSGIFFTLDAGQVLIASQAQVNMWTDGVSDTFYFCGIPLDYTQCTSPSGATSASDLMSLIRDLA